MDTTSGGISEQITMGVVSMHCTHDVSLNLQKYFRFIESASQSGVRFLVFPEMSIPGYLRVMGEQGSAERSEQFRYYRSIAESIPGPITSLLQEQAQKHRMIIQAGLAERTMSGNILYNSTALIGPTGLIGVFRKAHNPFEWPIFSPGNSLSVFDTPIGKIGMFICYDLCFPEVGRVLALKGAAILSMSTAWAMQTDDPTDDPSGHVYDVLTPATALANQVWLVCSNQVRRPPTEGSACYYGHSRIISPAGRIIVDSGYEESLVTATVDVREGIERARTLDIFGNNLLADRRPELYGIVADSEIYHAPEVGPSTARDLVTQRARR